MSSSVDSRIVTMKFENSAFQRGVGATLGALDKLKKALKFDGASKGLTDVQNTANRFNMGGMSSAVSGVSKGFLAMSTIAITALATITTKAVDAGLRIAKALTIQPVLDGFHEYETQMGAIQTILSNTKDKGSTLTDVNKALQQLNTYSDKTIYNFTEMTRNIGTFTAAGIDLKTSVSAIKGIANLAAMSGSTSAQASSAMYQLSQALASGKVGLQDWNSVVNAGMGGAVFQKALVRTAQNMGTITKNAVGVSGEMKTLTINGKSFRDSIAAQPGQTSWLTSDVLTNTLKQLSGDMNAAQLKAQGFTDAQVKAIQSMGKEGQEAATKVKTLTQLMDTVKEAVGSGWTQSFQIILGNFTEARTTFTNVSNSLGAIVKASAKARNKMLGDWKKLGGRTVLIKAIGSAFNSVMTVIGQIKTAFHDIFPPATGKDLFNLTKAFSDLVDKMQPSIETVAALRRIFRGAFAVFDIFWQIIKGVAAGIGELFDSMGAGNGNFLIFLAQIGDAVYDFDQFLKRTGLIKTFFVGLGKILSVPIDLIKNFGKLLGSLFTGKVETGLDSMSGAFGRVGDRFHQILGLSDGLAAFGDKVHTIFNRISDAVQPMIDAIANAFSGLGNAIADALNSGDYNSIIDILNTGLLAGILLAVKKFFSNGLNIDLGGGMFGQIREAFGALTGSMKAMQTNIQADTLQKIAIAIGLLTLSVVALSLIDSARLTKALTAMTVAFGQLLAAMAILVKVSGSAGFIKVPMIAASMVLLSGAILILTAAIAMMGRLKWETIGKGLTGIAGALVVIGVAMRMMPKGMVLQAAALTLIGAALVAITAAVAGFGMLSWGKIAKGLVGIAGALVIIAGAIALMPPTMILQAVGLALISKALLLIAAAVAGMGMLSWEQIAKGLVALGGALVVLAGGLALMNSALLGAAALAVAAASLALLVPVLVALGNMSWGDILKSLIGLAGAFTVIGLAGLVLAPLIPVLLGLGAAIALLGVGLALTGAGALAFATAFGIVVAAGGAGIVIMNKAIGVIINAIPRAIKAFGKGVVEFAKVIGNGIPAFVKAFSAILTALLRAVIKVAPLIGRAFMVVLDTALKVIVKATPKIARAGLDLIIGLLKAMRDKIPKIIDVATDIIVRFLKALQRNVPRITNQGMKTIAAFLEGIAKAIDNNAKRIRNAGLSIAWSMINGITGGLLGKGVELVRNAAAKLASYIPGPIKKILGIASPSKVARRLAQFFGEGLLLGLSDSNKKVGKSAETVANTALDGVKKTFSKVSDAVSDKIDSNPIVTPVLDLSQIQNDANKIDSMVGSSSIKANLSYSQASKIAKAQRAQKLNQEQRAADRAKNVEIKFEQKNYSPESLSPVKIYRNTKSQLELAKEALKTNAVYAD